MEWPLDLCKTALPAAMAASDVLGLAKQSMINGNVSTRYGSIHWSTPSHRALTAVNADVASATSVAANEALSLSA
jgi:hypothetical protein